MSRSLAEADEYRRHQMDKARQIQNHLMPRPDDSEPLGIHHAYIPADDVGGDFFDTRVIDDQRVAFWVGDVTGHGIPAAMSASMLEDPASVRRRRRGRPRRRAQPGQSSVPRRHPGRRLRHDVYGRHRPPQGATCSTPAPATRSATCSIADGRIDELGSTGLLLGIDPDAACEVGTL